MSAVHFALINAESSCSYCSSCREYLALPNRIEPLLLMLLIWYLHGLVHAHELTLSGHVLGLRLHGGVFIAGESIGRIHAQPSGLQSQ